MAVFVLLPICFLLYGLCRNHGAGSSNICGCPGEARPGVNGGSQSAPFFSGVFAMGCRCKERRQAIIGAVKTVAAKGMTIISGKAPKK